MLQTFFAVLAQSFGEVQFSLRDALVHQDPASLHQARATTRRTKRKLLRAFADFQFRARAQSIARTKRLGENNTPKFVQFKFHRTKYAILYWQWQYHLAIGDWWPTCHLAHDSGGWGPVWLQQSIDFRCQDEVRLGQPIHRVCPGGDLDLAPSQQDVGMVPLLLGQFAHSIHESQGGPEIGKLVGAHEVMFIDDIPLRRFRQLTMNFGEFVTLQRRNTAAAGDAISVCKHGLLVLVRGESSAPAWTLRLRPGQAERALVPTRARHSD